MDVTKLNFDTLMPEIDEAIKDCDFVAFDGEFTGLGDPNPSSELILGTYEDYYHITKDKINPFQLIQVGLTVFKRLENLKYNAKVFNFYIFPQQNQYLKEVRKFLCQSSSIMFLSKNNFDFDKLFRGGIDYLTVEHENSFMSRPKPEAPINIISAKDKAFVADVITSVKKFLESTEEKMILSNKNGYYRKLLYQTLAQSGLEKEVNYDFCFKTNVIRITRRPKDSDFETAMGFTRVIKSLIKYQKPLVGHNCFLDILYLFKSFIGDLSQSYFEFKTQMSKYFPMVYDTKLMSEDPKAKALIERNSLEELEKRLAEDPFPKIQFESNLTGAKKYHDAGYDSFITGKSFIVLAKFLGESNAPASPSGGPAALDYMSFQSPVLSQYKNKLMVRLHRGQYMNLFEEDLPLTRKDVFHLQVAPDKRASDIHKMFEDFGGLARLLWKDDTQVFAILKDENRVRDVVQKFVIDKNGPADIQLQLYDDFLRRFKNSKRKFGNKDLGMGIEVHCSQNPRAKPRSKNKPRSMSKSMANK